MKCNCCGVDNSKVKTYVKRSYFFDEGLCRACFRWASEIVRKTWEVLK